MTATNSNRIQPHDLKLLITTVALAATLGGWSVLANRDETAVATTALSNTAGYTLPDLPVVATIVPADFTTSYSTAAGSADVPPVPALRRVSVAPAPVTTTRSSR